MQCFLQVTLGNTVNLRIAHLRIALLGGNPTSFTIGLEFLWFSIVLQLPLHNINNCINHGKLLQVFYSQATYQINSVLVLNPSRGYHSENGP